MSRIVEEARGLYSQQQVTPQQQQVMQNQIDELDPERALTDPKGYQADFVKFMQNMQQQQIAQIAAPVLAQQKESARWMAQSDKQNTHVFDKWGSEVDKLVEDAVRVGAVPSKALYDQAAKMVKANHLDELVAEKMSTMQVPETQRVTPTSVTGDEAQDATLWEQVEKTSHGKALLGAVGKAGIMRHAEKQGISLKGYLESITKTRTMHDPLKPGTWSSQLV